jgi:subtilisin family serine protease
MKKICLLFFSMLFLFLFGFLAGGRHPGSPQVEPSVLEKYVPNEVLGKLKKDTGQIVIQQAIDTVQGNIKTYLGNEITTGEWAATAEVSTQRSFLDDPALFQIKVPASIGTEQAIYLLSLNPNVEYAEPNYIIHALETIPNDQHFSKLWGLRNSGQSGGTADADIDASNAWDIHTGSTSIVVAVIDTGVDYNHPDLQTNIWNNPGETGGGKENNGVDDDGNGYVDDWRGWNFSATPGNNNPMDDNWYDPVQGTIEPYHGTHVAGIIGAKGNNSIGVAGVCWNIKLMPLKCFDYAGYGDSATAIRCIDYATSNGAHVSNNSYGYYTGDPLYNQSFEGAIERARASGRIFVASASNENNNNDITPVYPASCDLDNVISVLATDHNDSKSTYSNFGWYSVDVGAPGGSDPNQSSYNIYSTKQGNRYQYHAGTSMAAPYTAGLIALIKAHRLSLNWWQVKTILMKSVDPKSSLSGKCATQGRINAYNALTTATPNLPAAPSNLNTQAFGCDVKLTWTDNSSNESGFYVYRKTGNIFIEIGSTGPNVTTFWDYDLPSGTYYYYVRAYNGDGTSQRTLVKSIKLTGC